jgi:AAA15 family ATPase/GTPase
MSKLLLDSLEIKGYRCFEHLTIEKLGRVNLIVGKNNVGKTALLEALWIYCHKGSSDELIKLLQKREQFSIDYESTENLHQLNQLFFGTPNLYGKHQPIFISPKHKKDYCLQIGVVLGKIENGKVIEIKSLPTDSEETRDDFFLHNSFLTSVIGIDFKKAINKKHYTEIREMRDFNGNNRIVNFHYFGLIDLLSIDSFLISSQGIDRKTTAEIWDRIALTDIEDLVIEALQVILPSVKRISFIENNFYSLRIPVIRLEGMKNSEPLKVLGEGMERILGIIFGLARCKDGILLIDEIENGFHYSILPDVWKLIFKTAKDLNVQVFATTHSKDCIEAFTQAAVDDEESEGMLIRLERKDEKIKALTFDEKELETISRRDIEVR